MYGNFVTGRVGLCLVCQRMLLVFSLLLSCSFSFSGSLSVSRVTPKLPLVFEENAGQAPAEVRFIGRTSDFHVFLADDKVTWIALKDSEHGTDRMTPGSSKPSLVEMTFLRMNAEVSVRGERLAAASSSYLKGRNAHSWLRNVKSYQGVRYSQIYPGVDLLFYGNGGLLEYDFILSPGADPDAIKLKFIGIYGMAVEEEGHLVLSTPSGQLRHLAPSIFQEVGSTRTAIPGSYRLSDDDVVTFDVGPYEGKLALTIDPILVYSTYLGGSLGDVPAGVAVDSEGAVYLTGSTGSLDFPLVHPVQEEFAGGGSPLGDIFVTKIDPSGSRVIYSTYIGGTGTDVARGIAIDSEGNAVVTGTTFSGDFPATTGAFQTACSGQCPFVFKLNQDGSELVFSTFIGRGDGGAVAIDKMDQIIITGKTSSEVPVLNATQPERKGQSDAFVSKLNSSGSNLLFSTYLGGSGNENLIGKHDVSTDPMGNIYVVGRTDSPDFPVQSALQETIGGNEDAFVVKYSPNGVVIYSTFLGGSQDDEGRGIVADEEGRCVVVGTTLSPDFPTLSALQEQFGGGAAIGDAFVSKIGPAGEALVFSTYLGGQLGDVANDVALDSLGQPVVVGNGASNFPVLDPLRDFDGIDNYVAKFSADGSELVYSTPVGGGDQDIFVASTGTGVFVAGNISSGNYPVLKALQPRSKGGTEVFLAHIAEGGTLYFAQFANGMGAISDILLTGSSPVSASTVNIIFRGKDGETVHPNVSVVGGTLMSDGEEGLEVEVPPLGLARITSDGQGPLGAGSVTVDHDNPLGGTIRFTLSPFGTAGVGESELVRGFITPVRRTAISTGVAIFNTEDRQIGLTMRLRNMAGEEVAGGLRSTALVAHGHLAQFIHEIFPNADLENFEGTLTVETSSANALIAATALELGSQPGQFTTLPITPVP